MDNEKEYGVLATDVFRIMKKNTQRMYVCIIVLLALNIISVADSMYVRHRKAEIIAKYENVIKNTENKCVIIEHTQE